MRRAAKSREYRTSVSTLVGQPVLHPDGSRVGRIVELAVAPEQDSSRVGALLLRVPGQRALRVAQVEALRRGNSGHLELSATGHLLELDSAGNPDPLLLERDLLDQQIIDVHGRKVVRVNDVDLHWEHGSAPGELRLRIAEVEIGLRGALRRLLKGLPPHVVESLVCRIAPRVIPWGVVDLIDRDPARRVRLRVGQESLDGNPQGTDKLSSMHPSDLADILEDLAPAERDAVFRSLDEDVAAEALEEVELKTQKTLIASMDSGDVADILEEMDPAAAADLLNELPDSRSDEILEEMEPEERQDVEDLLDYEADTAAGLMTTDFVCVLDTASNQDATEALRNFDGDVENITDIFLLDRAEKLCGQVSVARLLLAPDPSQPVRELREMHMVSSDLEASGRKVAELFDKYNLRCLPVRDEHGGLAGVIRAEQVIAWLRARQ